MLSIFRNKTMQIPHTLLRRMIQTTTSVNPIVTTVQKMGENSTDKILRQNTPQDVVLQDIIPEPKHTVVDNGGWTKYLDGYETTTDDFEFFEVAADLFDDTS
jgi:hypothetical protein